MQIRLNLDGKGYREKPGKNELGAIRLRLCNEHHIVTITPEELIEAVRHGQTFTPQAMTGTTGNTWQSQQILCADIDNAKDLLDENGEKVKDKDGKVISVVIDSPLTPERAIEAMKGKGIEHYFLYHTFSSKPPGWPKFRVVLVLDAPIPNREKASDLAERLAQLFNDTAPGCTDTAVKDNARIFLGGRPDGIICQNGRTTSLDKLEALPPSRRKEDRPKEKPHGQEWKARPQPRIGGSYAALMARYEAGKDSFDLAEYVVTTTGARREKVGNTLYLNPCPLCGHTNCFSVTGNLYKDFGGTGGTGGSIIDYLMHKHNLSAGEAIDKFKFEIMGYDREEWKRAWMEENGTTVKDDFRETAPRAEGAPPQGQKEEELEVVTVPAAQDGPGQDAAPVPQTKSGVEMLDDFFTEVQTRAFEPIPTGVRVLDELLDGGPTRRTLVTIGAAPAMGKTVLAQWIAENMAMQGHDCLYLNLEMDFRQLLSRSVARHVWARYGRDGDISATQVMRGYAWDGAGIRDKVTDIYQSYRERIAPHLVYNPPGFTDNNLSHTLAVMDAERDRLKALGRPAPVVVLDYLQLLDAEERDATEAVKSAVKRLKDWAVDSDSIVFLVVAHNRESNKTGRADMESSRDSSGIEYSGDTMLTLSYYAVEKKKEVWAGDYTGTGDKRVKAKKPCTLEIIRDLQSMASELKKPVPPVCKDIALKLVKNRWGDPGGTARLFFDGRHSVFRPWLSSDSRGDYDGGKIREAWKEWNDALETGFSLSLFEDGPRPEDNPFLL